MADEDSILLHPDALHCLKRKQLVSLCRRLDIKANGKSADLIARLQDFAAANISPNSPTRGNLALLRHVKRSRPSYQETASDDEDDDDAQPPQSPDGAGETIASEPVQSLRRSPRKRNINHLPAEPAAQLSRPQRQSAKATGGQQREAATSSSAQAQVADLSLDIDRMLRDINSPTADDVEMLDGRNEAERRRDEIEPYLAEFGSMAAMDVYANASAPVSASASLDSKASSTTSPWKALSGSLKGLKNGLQRMGSLSKGSKKTALGEKRRRDEHDVGSKEEEALATVQDDEATADRSMPGSFDRSMLCNERPADEFDDDAQPPQTAPLRIIKPRPSRSRASLAPALLPVISASPSKLYPDLKKLGSSAAGSAGPRAAPAPMTSLPSISNAQFQTASESILADLNARLAAKGVSTTSLSTLGGNGQWGSSTASLRDLGLSKGKGTRFDNEHEKEFGKMDSIANHYAAKRAKANTVGPGTPSGSANARMPPPGAARPALPRMGSNSVSSTSLAQRGGVNLSTAASSKRIRVSEDPNRPGLSTSASTRSVATPGMNRSTTATSVSSMGQRELQKKRLELARQRRLREAAAARVTSAASTSPKAKERSRLERIKMGIKGMIHGSSSSQASGSDPRTAAAVATKKVDDGSVNSTKSAISTASAASATSTAAGSTISTKKPVFDLKASLGRKPSTARPTSAAGSVASTRPATSSTSMADRLRTQGWTGSSTAPTASSQQRPVSATTAKAREFGSLRTNVGATSAGVSRPAMTNSTSVSSLNNDAQKKAVLKAVKPVAGTAKRTRGQPERILQRKKEAIAQAAVRTTMLASSSSMDIARRRAEENRKVVFPSSASGAVAPTQPTGGSTVSGPAAQQQQASSGASVTRKISSRNMSNPAAAAPRLAAASSGVNGAASLGVKAGMSVAESMRAARLAELKARNRAAEAGIGLGRTPSPVKPLASQSTATQGGIAAQNRFTLLQNSPTKMAVRAGPTLTPRSSSLRNLRKMMRTAGRPNTAASGLRTMFGEMKDERNGERERAESNVGGIRLVTSCAEPVPTPTGSPIKEAAMEMMLC